MLLLCDNGQLFHTHRTVGTIYCGKNWHPRVLSAEINILRGAIKSELGGKIFRIILSPGGSVKIQFWANTIRKNPDFFPFYTPLPHASCLINVYSNV